MKTFGKMSFGFSIVNAGQRQTVVEPQLVFVSTPGSIRITAPVSKALGIQHGDNVMFINNIPDIDEAIRSENEELVAFATENGLTWGSPEANAAIHAAFDAWWIGKGIQLFDKKGNPKMVKERLSKEDRLKFVEANFEAMYEGAKNSENAELVAQLTREGITDAEIKDILCDYVENNEVPMYSGSKAANPAKLTGVGTNLNFTDSAIWNQIKEDLEEEVAKSTNRTFTLDVEKAFRAEINNGFENVGVTLIQFIGEGCTPFTDEKVSRVRKSKADDAEAGVSGEAAE